MSEQVPSDSLLRRSMQFLGDPTVLFVLMVAGMIGALVWTL